MVFFSICVFCLCYLSVLSVCVFCLCFLSGFAFYRTTKNDTFLRINFDIILLWSGLADQLLFADINSQLIWLQYKYKILTRYFGLSGSPASSFSYDSRKNHPTYHGVLWRPSPFLVKNCLLKLDDLVLLHELHCVVFSVLTESSRQKPEEKTMCWREAKSASRMMKGVGWIVWYPQQLPAAGCHI